MIQRAIVAALVLFAGAPQHASAAPLTATELTSYPFCDLLDQDTDPLSQPRISEARHACQLRTDDVTPEVAEAALGDRRLALAREDDHITVYEHAQDDAVTLCCSIQTLMTRIGTSDYWVTRLAMSELDHASLTFIPAAPIGTNIPLDQIVRWRGPLAPPAPEKVQPIRGRMFETTLYSPALHETRKLQIYLPPGYERHRHYPAVFVADGEAVAGYAPIAEALVAQHKIAPVIIIGSLAGQRGIVEDRSSLRIEDLRHADYLFQYPGAGDRFERHLKFFCDELTHYAEVTYGASPRREDRAVTGFSDGGIFALWAGIRCSNRFAASWPMSGGWLEQRALPAPTLPVRFLMSAGIYEPGFHYTTQRAADLLRADGQAVTMRDYAAAHMPDQWELAFAEDAAATFPP